MCGCGCGCVLGCIRANTNKRKSVLSQCVILWVRKKLDHILCGSKTHQDGDTWCTRILSNWVTSTTGCNMWSTVFPLKMCSCFCYYLIFMFPGNFVCTWVKIYHHYSERSSCLQMVQFPCMKYDAVIKLVVLLLFFLRPVICMEVTPCLWVIPLSGFT